MTTDWLYPLSSKADYYFELSDGNTANTGPACFEQMIRLGGYDANWHASKGWKQIERNDRMWVYYGTADGDMGVVGCAVIKSVEKPEVPNGRAILHLRWEFATTKRLIKSPFPASRVREYIGHPQGPVWRIDPKLAAQIRQHVGGKVLLGKESVAAPTYATGVTSTLSYTPPKKVTAFLRHDSLIRPFMGRLMSSGWTPMAFDVGSKKVDLAMSRRGRILLLEAKTVNGSTSGAVRSAFAQLAEYSWLHSDRNGIPTSTITQWGLFERRPSEDEIRFLEAQGVMVTWALPSARRLVHGIATARRAPSFGL